MIKRIVEITDISAEELAELFTDANADFQAKFFSHVGKNMLNWSPNEVNMQLASLWDSDQLTGAGIKLLSDLRRSFEDSLK